MHSVLAPASPDSALIAEMSWLLILGGAAIFAAVMALLAWAWRRRLGERGAVLWLAGGGVALPLVVLAALFAYSTTRSAQLTSQTSHDAMVITVTAKMWWWEVRYRDARGRDVLAANELHLPVGRRVYLALASSDVIHSLWIPALAGKMDMVPGRMDGLTVMVSEPGEYLGLCAEYCGMQHARMALRVVAVPPERFDAWLTAQALPAAAVGIEHAPGRRTFEQKCASCHTVREHAGVGAARATPGGVSLAPDLTHVASRRALAGGALPNNRAALAQWIADPQMHKPGVRMPASGLDPAAIDAVAAYLEQLR